MIAENLIRADLPDPILEPELYQLVTAHQIHTCNPAKCGGPAPPGQMCKKNFPRPYSPITYYNANEFRYTYRCITERDRWVVPYHAPTLLIWNAHMNIQYVSSKNLGKYLTKYVVKAEPSYVFNVSEGIGIVNTLLLGGLAQWNVCFCYLVKQYVILQYR